MSDIFQVPESNFHEVIIIGSGPCALATLSRLCERTPGSTFSEDEQQRFYWLRKRGNNVNLINNRRRELENSYYRPEDIMVLDPLGEWLSQWNSQFKSCQIPHLRSPMFFHPDPVNIDGMITFAHEQGRWDELKEIPNVVGKEFSKHQLKKLRNKKLKKDQVSKYKSINHDDNGIVNINWRDWKDYYRPSTPLFRDFCQEIIKRYKLENCVTKGKCTKIEHCYISVIGKENEMGPGFVIETDTGDIFGCKNCVVAVGHSGEINYPINDFATEFPHGSCHTTHLFKKEVMLSRKMKNVVVVGGGLTSAQICHVLIQSKKVDKVFLLIRSELKIKHFDFFLDWVTKYKNVKKSAFWMKDTDEERYEMIQDARQGGSVNPEYYQILKKYVKQGVLEIKQHTEITNQVYDTGNWQLEINNSEQLPPIEYIYFATGIKLNLPHLDFLNPIIDQHPIKFINQLPCLTDNLQWNQEIPLFVIGKYASLRIGPSSANLDGARLGAERIGWYLQDMKTRGKFKHEKQKQDVLDIWLQLASGDLNWYNLLSCEVSS